MKTAWEPRPRLAQALQVALVAVPVATAVLAGRWVSQVLPLERAPRTAVAVTVAVGVLALLELAGRRLLPLVTLLRLALVFPDHAPHRLRVALQAGSTRDLTTAARGPGEPEAQQAAVRVVRLLAALARHDRPTRRHSERVRAFTELLAEALHVPEADRRRLRWASLIHDLGKIRLEPTVLNKPSGLDDDEWQRVRAHPTAGAALAHGLEGFLGPYFDTIEQHHERWNGSGYPHGLRGEEICLGARIVAVADSFEVMTAGRPYRSALSPALATLELVECAAREFDPRVVRAFTTLSLGSLSRRGGPWAAAGVALLPAPHDVGLHPAAALHQATHAHVTADPSGHDAGGGLHHTGHDHTASAHPGPDQR